MKTIRSLLLFGALAATALAVSSPSLHAADESPPVTAASVVVVADSPAPASLAITADEPVSYQVTTAESTAALTWQQSLIVVLTPLIIAGLKKVVPSVPKGILPFLAPICGALLEVLSHLTTGSTVNVWAALALGAAGVGLREAVKQTRSAMAPATA